MNFQTTFFVDVSQPMGSTELLSAAAYVSGFAQSGDAVACFAGDRCVVVDLSLFVNDPVGMVKSLSFKRLRRPASPPPGVSPPDGLRVLITATCAPSGLREGFVRTVYVP